MNQNIDTDDSIVGKHQIFCLPNLSTIFMDARESYRSTEDWEQAYELQIDKITKTAQKRLSSAHFSTELIHRWLKLTHTDQPINLMTLNTMR